MTLLSFLSYKLSKTSHGVPEQLRTKTIQGRDEFPPQIRPHSSSAAPFKEPSTEVADTVEGRLGEGNDSE